MPFNIHSFELSSAILYLYTESDVEDNDDIFNKLFLKSK